MLKIGEFSKLSHLTVKNREQITAPELAKRFEVSRRTINRDIEALNRAGIPVVTQQGAGGGIRIMDGFRMDRTALTSGDMQAILAGLRSLDSISGTNQYRQLMEKISPGSSDLLSGDQYIMIDLASWHKASLSEKIELLHGAIELHRLVSFHYYSPNGESDRTVEPYLLVFQWTNWYLWAWCREKEAPRLFKLERFAFVDEEGSTYTANEGITQDVNLYSFDYKKLSKVEISVRKASNTEKNVVIAMPLRDRKFFLGGRQLLVCFMEINMDIMLSGVSMKLSTGLSTDLSTGGQEHPIGAQLIFGGPDISGFPS